MTRQGNSWPTTHYRDCLVWESWESEGVLLEEGGLSKKHESDRIVVGIRWMGLSLEVMPLMWNWVQMSLIQREQIPTETSIACRPELRHPNGTSASRRRSWYNQCQKEYRTPSGAYLDHLQSPALFWTFSACTIQIALYPLLRQCLLV